MAMPGEAFNLAHESPIWRRSRPNGGWNGCFHRPVLLSRRSTRHTAESKNTSAIISDENGLSRHKKVSLNRNCLIAKPACIAGVRICGPNFSARCGLAKL